VEFYQGGIKLSQDSTSPYTYEWAAAEGSYDVSAVAVDNAGLTTLSDIVHVTLTSANLPPEVSLTSPANGAAVPTGNVALWATASDSDGEIAKVEFYEGANKLGEATTAPFGTMWIGATEGSYSLTAVATDNGGATMTSSAVSVTVVDVGSLPAGSFVNGYDQNFDGLGTGGNTPPAGWSVWNGTPSSTNSTWTNTNGIIAGANSVANSVGTMVLSTANLSLSSAPTSNAVNGYNAGAPGNSANRMLASAPTSTNGMGFQLELTNKSGLPISNLEISYDIQRFTAPSSANELPGYQLFYSVDSGATWTNVSDLNPALSGAVVNVPNTIGVTQVPATVFALSSPWGNEGSLRLRWVDDNAVATSPDQIHGLDNVVISLPQPAPVVVLTAPVDGESFANSNPVLITADAQDANGAVTKVEFFANEEKVGEDSSSPFAYSWSGMASGIYTLTAKATDNDGGIGVSEVVSVTITNPTNVSPSVAITSPSEGELVPASTVTLTADASDTDGTVSKVEFYVDEIKIGEDVSAPYEVTWSAITVGSHSLKAVATDNDDGVMTSTVVMVEATAFTDTTTISRGATWKYLDDGSDQGMTWKEAAFDDSAWSSGPAKLGYQDGAVTVLRQGPDGMSSSVKYITYYFRKSFTVTDATKVLGLTVNLLRDDAAVIYLNGVEVARSNMPIGDVTYLTQSATIVSGADETTYFPIELSKASLVNGENVIAVSLHQRDNSSSDLGFDLDLLTTVAGGNALPVTQITAPIEGETFFPGANVTITANAQDSDGTVTKVEFYNGANKLGEDTTAPYEYVWNNVTAGGYALTTVATDDIGSTGTSPVVNITVTPGPSGTLTRVPYIQQGTSESMIFRWRSSQSVAGRVRYGVAPESLTQFVDESVASTEHTVKLTGLNPYTRYYYSVGSASDVLAGGDVEHTFVTSPISGTPVSTRIWVLGDAGTANDNQRAVRDAFYTWTGNRTPDFWIMLGDNAYNNGTQTEFQNAVFGIYPTMLNKSPLWSCIGNHETYGGTEANGQYPYQNIHEFPTNGEAGGVPSGTEKYYAWDYGDSHFISLDSMTSSRAANGAMANWLRDDLAATTKTWIICIFHHPPYTKGSHNSDTESELIEMRQNILPILEAGGVDLVLCGHSHSYERSYFMDGHYGSSGTFSAATHVKQTGNGRPASDGAYIKPLTGPRDHFGAVYAVAGSSGKISGGSLNHAAMFLSLNNLGSMVLDINDNRLDVTFIRENGTTPDSLTIIKEGAADSDKDGIADEYEIANGLDRFSAADANLDMDHDGVSNLEEYLCGMKAEVADRYAWTTTQDEETGNYIICYPTLAGRNYQVWYSSDLVHWYEGSSVVVGDGNLKCWVDDGTGGTPSASSGAGSRYYRVKVMMAP
ncbi:MAG: Ig-like domain-containing protein, partial [Prosthecobacter sp.]|nr:Ig-like domain-containing protein [Prosthecobacter sp.]